MKKITILCVVSFIILTLAGCEDSLTSHELPEQPAVLKTVDVAGTGTGGLEYNGRAYLVYGSVGMKGLRKKDIKECVGYVYREDYPDDTELHIYTLANDKNVDFLVEYYTVGVMEQPMFLRAIDTVGKDIEVYDFIDFYSPWSQGFWDMGIDTSGGELVSEVDSHSGLDDEGIYLSEIEFPDDSALTQIKNNEYWKELPFSDNIKRFFNENGDEIIQKLPEITHGYYTFYDRDSYADPYDDKDLYDGDGFYFDIMIYDSDTNTLYVCVVDK